MSYLYDDPPPGINIHADQRGRIIGSSVAILVITLTSVALRLLSRRLSRAGLWWDDYLTIVALIFSSACIVIILILFSDGLGRHIWFWNPNDRAGKARRFLIIQFTLELFIVTANGFAKLAVLLFYYRAFAIPRFRRLLIEIGIACAFIMVLTNLVYVFQCRPIHYAWDSVEGKIQGHCYNVVAFFIGTGSVNVLLNVIIFLLPVPLVWRLRTTLRQRIILFAIFTLAGFIVVVSIIWVVAVSQPSHSDFTWNFVDACIWCALEPNMAVVCACIPSLRPLSTAVTQGIFKSPLMIGTLHSISDVSSKSRWGSSKGKSSNGTISQLDQSEDLRPFGHGTTIRGGRMINGGDREVTAEVPKHRINVRIEITWITSTRLDYNDRLY